MKRRLTETMSYTYTFSPLLLLCPVHTGLSLATLKPKFGELIFWNMFAGEKGKICADGSFFKELAIMAETRFQKINTTEKT